MMNFNETFRKMLLMKILKVIKNQGFTFFLENTISEKPNFLGLKITFQSRYRVENRNCAYSLYIVSIWVVISLTSSSPAMFTISPGTEKHKKSAQADKTPS